MVKPNALDFMRRGAAVLIGGPIVAVLVVMAAPFIAIGYLTHCLGWHVEHVEDDF